MINQNFLFHIFGNTNKAINDKNVQFQIWEFFFYWTSKKNINETCYILINLSSSWNEENITTFPSN